jgi:hypothetical protein
MVPNREHHEVMRGRGGAWRYAAGAAVGVGLAVYAAVSTYGHYTELDRPSRVVALPFAAVVALVSVAIGLLASPDPSASVVATLRSAATGLAAAAAPVGVFLALAPHRPLTQLAAVVLVVLATPPAVWLALAFPGLPLVLARALVALIVVVTVLPAAVFAGLVALARGYDLSMVVVAAAIAVHVPLTLLSSLIDRRAGDEDREPVATVRSVQPVAAIAVGALGFAFAFVGLRSGARIDAGRDPVLAAVAAAHNDLNQAVGWDRWEPDQLEQTAGRLDEAATLADGGAPELAEAAADVRRALAAGDRDSAVAAHRIVAGFEQKIRYLRPAR